MSTSSSGDQQDVRFVRSVLKGFGLGGAAYGAMQTTSHFAILTFCRHTYRPLSRMYIPSRISAKRQDKMAPHHLRLGQLRSQFNTVWFTDEA